MVEEGWSGRSTVAGARAAASTPCLERSPVNFRSGGVESERGCTVKDGVSFIGADAGVGAGSSRCGAACGGPSAGACSGVSRARRTRGHFFLPEF